MSQDMKYKPSDKYLPCKDIKRQKPDMTVSKERSDEIVSNSRTLPIFSKALFELCYQSHYSLQTNEFLKCRWIQYKKHIEDRVIAPFQFLDIRDYYFHNGRIQLLPSMSVHTKTNFRKSLKPGPSVDQQGSMRPIPQELLMKKGGEEYGAKRQGKVKKGREKKSTLSAN